MGRPRGSRRRKTRPSMRVKSEANSPVLSPVEEDGRSPSKTHGNLPVPRKDGEQLILEDGVVEIVDLDANAALEKDVTTTTALPSGEEQSPNRTQTQGASPRRRRGKFPSLNSSGSGGTSSEDASSCPTSSEQSSQETAVSADAGGAEGLDESTATAEGTGGKRKRKQRRRRKKGTASTLETGNNSEGEDGPNLAATSSSSTSGSVSASASSSNAPSALSSMTTTSASSSVDDPSVSSAAAEQGATKKRSKNKKRKKKKKKNGEVASEGATVTPLTEGRLEIAEDGVGNTSRKEQTNPVCGNSDTGFRTTIVSSQGLVQDPEPTPTIDPASTIPTISSIVSSPTIFPTGDPAPTLAYSPTAEPDTTYYPYLGYSPSPASCPAPTFEPMTTLEPSTTVEPTTTSEPSTTFGAYATSEPTTTFEPSTTFGASTVFASAPEYETSTILESTTVVEPTTAITSTTCEHSADLAAKEPPTTCTAFQSPTSSSFEPSSPKTSSTVDNPDPSLSLHYSTSFDPAQSPDSTSSSNMFPVPVPEEADAEVTTSRVPLESPSADAEVPAAAAPWAGSTCPRDTAEFSVLGQDPSPQQESFSRVAMPSAKDVFGHPEARRTLDSVFSDMSEEDTSVVSVTPASTDGDRLLAALWRQDTIDVDNAVFEDDNACVVVSETQWMKCKSLEEGEGAEAASLDAGKVEAVDTCQKLLEEETGKIDSEVEGEGVSALSEKNLNKDGEQAKEDEDLFPEESLDKLKALSITETPTEAADYGAGSSVDSHMEDHLRGRSEDPGLPEEHHTAEGASEEQTAAQSALSPVSHSNEIEEPNQPTTDGGVFEVADLMENLNLKPEWSPVVAGDTGIAVPETVDITGSSVPDNLPDLVKTTSGPVSNNMEEAVEGGSSSAGDTPKVAPSSQEPSAFPKAEATPAEGGSGQPQDTSEAKVDAALAELDSLPDEVCESGDVEEEEEEEEEWSYFRMEPQTHKRTEEEFVSNTMPESDMPEVGGQQEQQQEVVEYNNAPAPTHFGGPMTPEDFGGPPSLDMEHAMPMEAAVAPVMEKSFGLDASPSSPRAGSPPRSVEGFITSVEVNTPEESFATSVSINQSADMFTNPGVEQSGPFSVYVSNSPEPASMDPPTFPAGPPAHLEPSSPTAAASPALGSDVEAPASPKSSAEATVEIVHAQSLVEVDSPPSPVDAPTAFPSSLDLGADSPAPSHPSDPVQSDSLLADNSFTDEPVTEPITDALVDFAPKAETQPCEVASPAAPLTPATPVSPQLDLLDQMEQNEGKMEEQFMSRPFESEFISDHVPHHTLEYSRAPDPMTQSIHLDEPIQISSEMEGMYYKEQPEIPKDYYSEDFLASNVNKSEDYRGPVETITAPAPEVPVISPEVPDRFSEEVVKSPELILPKSPEEAPVISPKEEAPVKSPEEEAPVKSPELVPVKSPEVAPVKTPVGEKKTTKGAKATPGKATPGKGTPTPGRATGKTTPARSTPSATPRSTPGTTSRATPGTKPTPGRTPTTKAATPKTTPSKPEVKKATPSRTTPTAKSTSTTTAPKPSTRPTAAPRTTTKPAPPKTAPTSKPATATSRTTTTRPPATKPAPTSRTTTTRPTATRPTATKPTPTSRTTTKPAGSSEAKKPITARPSSRPTSSTVGTASSRTTSASKRPTTAPTRTEGKSVTDGPSKSLTARKPMTAKTTVDSKDSKNTTNRILSASRTTRTTKSVTATKTSSTTKSISDSKTSSTTTRMTGTAATKTKTTTAASKTATKTSAGVGIKKTGVNKTKITEVAEASATEAKMEPILNGENKIVDEETSVEVMEKVEAEESSITSSQVVEKIISETSSSEQVVTAEQMSTELLVNGDH